MAPQEIRRIADASLVMSGPPIQFLLHDTQLAFGYPQGEEQFLLRLPALVLPVLKTSGSQQQTRRDSGSDPAITAQRRVRLCPCQNTLREPCWRILPA